MKLLIVYLLEVKYLYLDAIIKSSLLHVCTSICKICVEKKSQIYLNIFSRIDKWSSDPTSNVSQMFQTTWNVVTDVDK